MKHFIISIGGLTDDVTTDLADFLQRKYGLKELNLRFSGTGDIGVIAKALYHNSTICVLKWYGNSIGESGAVSLSLRLFVTTLHSVNYI